MTVSDEVAWQASEKEQRDPGVGMLSGQEEGTQAEDKEEKEGQSLCLLLSDRCHACLV